MMNTLFLRLESPLQAWGEDSQWSERRTAPEPTKSGIVGLLSCALGWNDDERIRNLSRKIRVGIRHDVRGTSSPLRDFHTVGGGYLNPQLLTAEGKPKFVTNTKNPHTEPTSRYYLCDASFLVAVRADAETIEELAKAIQSPVWTLFLGRKCCVPTRPPFDGTGDYNSLQDALEQHPARFLNSDITYKIENKPRIIVECEAGEGIRRRDQIISRTYRRFEPRYSREHLLDKEIRIEYLDEGGC